MGKHCNWGYRSLLLAASREKDLRPARTAPFEPFEAAQPATAAPAAAAVGAWTRNQGGGTVERAAQRGSRRFRELEEDGPVAVPRNRLRIVK